MLTAIIVDDERHAREGLRDMISTAQIDVNVVGLASEHSEARALIHDKHPDLVFLNINPEDQSRFSLLSEQLPRPFHVVFTSAHKEYAVEAFRFNAVDYLLKPYRLPALEEALTKVVIQSNSVRKIPLEQLFNISNKENHLENKLAVPTIHGYNFINHSDLLYCQADRNYTQLHLIDGGKIISSINLGEVHKMIHCSGFFRIHNSYIINLRYVNEFRKGSPAVIVLVNDVELPVASRRKSLFLQRMLNRES